MNSNTKCLTQAKNKSNNNIKNNGKKRPTPTHISTPQHKPTFTPTHTHTYTPEHQYSHRHTCSTPLILADTRETWLGTDTLVREGHVWGPTTPRETLTTGITAAEGQTGHGRPKAPHQGAGAHQSPRPEPSAIQLPRGQPDFAPGAAVPQEEKLELTLGKNHKTKS